MTDFANLADAGRRLGVVLRNALTDVPDPLVLAVIPNGVPVAVGIREVWPVTVQGLPAERSATSVVIHPGADVSGRHVVVVDDGVETGRVARVAAAALVVAGAASVTLAVPVCPRDAMDALQDEFNRIVAVAVPSDDRTLSSHYADFDTIDEAEARRLLESLPT